MRPIHGRIAVASSVGVFCDGYGLGNIGLALSLAATPLDLNPLWTGLLGAASLAGLFGGALFAGPVADRYGRRPIFAVNMAFLAGLSALQFFAHERLSLLALRLAIGFLLGTDYVVSKALLTEFTPHRLRGRIMGLLSVAWAAGYACSYAVGYALLQTGPEAWRWMLMSSALPCIAVLPLRLGLPESPLWLASHGRETQAAAIVRALLGEDVLPPAAAPGTRVRWRH